MARWRARPRSTRRSAASTSPTPSAAFDHTSTIRFLEARFGVHEPNITPWHRAVSGDLSSCFDFDRPNDREPPALADMSYATGDDLVVDLPAVVLPEEQALPRQDAGLRYSRALPYVLHAHARSSHGGELSVEFDNQGRAGAVLHVYDRLHLERLPRRYTIEAGKSLSDVWDTADDDGRYDLWLLGPNGFLRHFTGAGGRHLPEVELRYHASDSALELLARARGGCGCALLLSANAYGREPGCRLQPRRLQRPGARRLTALTRKKTQSSPR